MAGFIFAQYQTGRVFFTSLKILFLFVDTYDDFK